MLLVAKILMQMTKKNLSKPHKQQHKQSDSLLNWE